MVMTPRAILLDIDDTIYAYEPCHQAGLRSSHVLCASLLPGWAHFDTFLADYRRAREVVKSRVKGTAPEHCRLLYFKEMTERRLGGIRVVEARALHTAYWESFLAEMELFPGCLETLREWRAAGIALAWVTNFTTERQMIKLQALGIESMADALVTSEEAGAEKPSPAPFLLALERLGVAPQSALVIGDDEAADVRGAQALSMRAIRFEPPMVDWPTLRRLVAAPRKLSA